MFGKKEEVTEVRHLLGTAMGGGGLPEHEAYYLTVTPNLPVGAYELSVKDVPVDAFWSISVYNEDGYFQQNEYEKYVLNSRKAKADEDGSVTIYFGGESSQPNFLPIMPGWNYMLRIYLPQAPYFEGSWEAPEAQPTE